MAGQRIILIHLLLIAHTISYSVDQSASNQLVDRRPVPEPSSEDLSSALADCAPVQVNRARQCEFLPKAFQYFGLFEAICQQHQLCYACGSIHGISERKCNALSRIYMYEQCSKDPSTKMDCLEDRFFALFSLADDTYRVSSFAPECYDDCIVDYLFLNPNTK